MGMGAFPICELTLLRHPHNNIPSHLPLPMRATPYVSPHLSPHLGLQGTTHFIVPCSIISPHPGQPRPSINLFLSPCCPIFLANASAFCTPTLWFLKALSTRRQYLNIGLALKTGKQENGIRHQQLSMVEMDSVMNGSQLQSVHLQLYHHQGGVPEYYSTHGYISIPIRHLPRGCRIKLSIKTYQGYIHRDFIL